MAETLVWVQENNINDLTELNDLCKTAQSNAQAAYERLSQAEDELYKTNEQIHYPCYFPTNRSIKALIKNTKIAWDVLHKEKPDLIISCGAAVAVPFFYIGKMIM